VKQINKGLKILYFKKGQSLFEVVVAVGLSALILISIASLATKSVSNSSYTKTNAQATKYVQEEIEWLRSQRDYSWNGFISSIVSGGCDSTDTTMSWGSVCDIDSLFKRTANFVCKYYDISTGSESSLACNSGSENINIVEVDVLVSWSDSSGNHQVGSFTRFTKWR